MNKEALTELQDKCLDCIEAWKNENWHKPLDIEYGDYIEHCRLYGEDEIQNLYDEVWDDAPEDDEEVQEALWKVERRLMEKNYEGEDINREYFGARIAYLRKRRKMTQQQLADEIGIKREHVSRIEAGKYSVGLDIICKVAKALHMELEFIRTD